MMQLTNTGEDSSVVSAVKDIDTVSECSTVEAADSLCSAVSDDEQGVETLIIFDWDDTLFPTTWIMDQGFVEDADTKLGLLSSLSSGDRALLDAVTERARRSLQMANSIGHVAIVTNAEQGWVEYSCAKFMPSLLETLTEVPIISARSTYAASCTSSSQWKCRAFRDLVDGFYGTSGVQQQQQNVVSVGDSDNELRALLSVSSGVSNCCGKSLKFVEAPSMEQLVDQHDLLIESLLDVVEHNGDLDVEIGKEVA